MDRPSEDSPAHIPPEHLPRLAEAVIEVPRGSFLKRAPSGRLEFLSPLPCPFNYGSVPGTLGPDGDPMDVIVLGPRLPRGPAGARPVVARVRFSDQGVPDPKWVCAEGGASPEELLLIDRFFSVYALGKLAFARARGSALEVRYAGLDVVREGRVIRAWSSGVARARYRAPAEDGKKVP